MICIRSEKSGNRKFERISNWNVLTDTIISRKNKMAAYADDTSANADKLWITCIHQGGKTYPIRRFAVISPEIVLEDNSVISRQDVENSNLYMEINATKDKVRLYREVK